MVQLRCFNLLELFCLKVVLSDSNSLPSLVSSPSFMTVLKKNLIVLGSKVRVVSFLSSLLRLAKCSSSRSVPLVLPCSVLFSDPSSSSLDSLDLSRESSSSDVSDRLGELDSSSSLLLGVLNQADGTLQQ